MPRDILSDSLASASTKFNRYAWAVVILGAIALVLVVASWVV